jgi:hypothetical protein
MLLFSGCIGFLQHLADTGKKSRFSPPSEEQREKYVEDHPDLSSLFREYILEGEIDVGMTKEDVKASWGKPDYTYKADYRYREKPRYLKRLAHENPDKDPQETWYAGDYYDVWVYYLEPTCYSEGGCPHPHVFFHNDRVVKK